MNVNLLARNSVRAIVTCASILILAACGSNPPPAPAPVPVPGNPYMGSCGSVTGVSPVQVTPGSTPGYYADLVTQNPMYSGNFMMNLFYTQAPQAGMQVQNIVGSGAIKLPILTGGYQSGNLVPLCVSSNGNSPGQISIAQGAVQIRMTGPLPSPQQNVYPTPYPTSYGGYPQMYPPTTGVQSGSIEVRVGFSCPAGITPQGRIKGCIDVYSYGYISGSQSYIAN